MDLAAVEEWVRRFVVPTAPVELVRERPWASVATVPTADGVAWFKACEPVQAFEPGLTARVADRSPALLPVVLGWDGERRWLLTADAGARIGDLGNPPEVWERVLPRYAELQLREAAYADEHVTAGVPDRRPERLPEQFDEFVRADLPAAAADRRLLREFTDGFAALCAELAAAGVGSTVQHDDLHSSSLHVKGDSLRIIDWGDTSIAHPMSSLVVLFEFLREEGGLAPDDPWFGRLRAAYLEPFGSGWEQTAELAERVGTFARAIGWLRQREAMGSLPYRVQFDAHYGDLLHRTAVRVER